MIATRKYLINMKQRITLPDWVFSGPALNAEECWASVRQMQCHDGTYLCRVTKVRTSHNDPGYITAFSLDSSTKSPSVSARDLKYPKLAPCSGQQRLASRWTHSDQRLPISRRKPIWALSKIVKARSSVCGWIAGAIAT
jgi:hypothetical protein